ncbi:MAG: hypothetical protein BWY63_02303 [Chloroflexi bacterium ADurb.Bin360]|nr:MAG: hypothetical protein BWY63_02303 [Chloroflexi bacterium ADurb.Bin360]
MKPFLFTLALLSMLIGFLALGNFQAQAGTPAQASAGYELGWWTVDGGGTQLAGGDFLLLGTVGQPEAGNALSGGGFELGSGFWSGGTLADQHTVFLPLVMRN